MIIQKPKEKIVCEKLAVIFSTSHDHLIPSMFVYYSDILMFSNFLLPVNTFNGLLLGFNQNISTVFIFLSRVFKDKRN